MDDGDTEVVNLAFDLAVYDPSDRVPNGNQMAMVVQDDHHSSHT